MKRTGVFGVIAMLAVLLSLVLPAHSQSRTSGQEKNHSRGNHQSTNLANTRREYAPRVIGRANSFIVRGRLVALRGQQMSIETAAGGRLDFQVDEQTTWLESGELVSIATMDDITLRPSDLRLADELEVIAERAGGRRFARIVTRTASGQPVARR